MSDILIVGSAGFVGSNITNYLIQHTRYNLSSIDDLESVGNLKRLAPAMEAKYRHTFYLANVQDTSIIKKILLIEKPRVVIYTLPLGTVGKQLWEMGHGHTTLGFLNQLHHKPTVLFIGKGNTWAAALDEYSNTIGKWYVIEPCELFGPRQGGKVSKIIHNALNPDPEAIQLDCELEPRQWMYIKDFFYNLLPFISEENDRKSGIYRLVSEQWASEQDVSKYLSSLGDAERYNWKIDLPYTSEDTDLKCELKFDLKQALEHTLVWHKNNRWMQGVASNGI